MKRKEISRLLRICRHGESIGTHFRDPAFLLQVVRTDRAAVMAEVCRHWTTEDISDWEPHRLRMMILDRMVELMTTPA